MCCFCSTAVIGKYSMKKYIYTYRVFVQWSRSYSIIKTLILRSRKRRFSLLFRHNIIKNYMYNRTLYAESCDNVCTYIHRHWKPLQLLCSWSGYWLEIRKYFTVLKRPIYWTIKNVEEDIHSLLNN